MKTEPLVRLGSRICMVTALAVAGLIISLTPRAQASTVNLVQNGEFTTSSVPSPIQVVDSFGDLPFGGAATLANWTASGLVVLFGPSGGTNPSMTNADIGGGAPNHFGPGGGFRLWGPGNLTTQMPQQLTLGPNGSNFLALDAARADQAGLHVRGSITQTVSGLTPNVPVTITFNWAAGQQQSFSGATTEQLQVSLGGQSQFATIPTTCGNPAITCPGAGTQTVMLPNHGFQGWMQGSLTFTPTSPSQVLSFMAIGTPEVGTATAGPPFVLLESVALNKEENVIPEPGTWSLLGMGFAAIAGVARRRPKWLNLPA